MQKRKLFLSLFALCSIVGMGITSCNNQGEQGPIGPEGPQGPEGPAGENGEDGQDGSLILTGEGKPEDSLGKDSDIYIDSKTGDLYQKDNGTWSLVMNIKGEDGSSGSSGSNGQDGKTAWSNTILPSEGGYVIPSAGSALVGEDVTFTVVPDSGYLLSSLLIFNNGEEVTLPEATVENSEVSYTLAMQEGGFVVSATFGEVSATGETSYYKDGQKYEGGLVDGLGNIITEGTVVKDAVVFEGGSGTSEDPLLVESKEQFTEITNTGESYFKLSENADFTGENKVDALPSTSETLEELSLDLNGNTIEFVAQDPTTTVSPIKVASDTTLTYKNGKIEANQMRDGGLSLFALRGDCTNNNIVLDNMEVETNGTAIYTQSVGSDIVIRDSVIHAGDYGVGTNASKGSAETDQISITIENSTISTLHEGDLTANENLYTNTGLFINVSAEVVVRDSTIEGDRQAVVVRGGEVTLENTTLNYTGNDYYSTLPHCYDGEWFTGNGVPVAAVTLGNNEANAYSTTTKLTMSGVTVNELTSINDSNSEISLLTDETPVTDPEKPYLLYANGESEENNVTIISDSSSYEQFKDSEGRVYINSLGDKVLLTIDDSLNTLKNNVFVDGQLYSSAYYDGDTFVKEKSVKVDGVKFNGGSGSVENPLIISSAEQLLLVNKLSGYKFTSTLNFKVDDSVTSLEVNESIYLRNDLAIEIDFNEKNVVLGKEAVFDLFDNSSLRVYGNPNFSLVLEGENENSLGFYFRLANNSMITVEDGTYNFHMTVIQLDDSSKAYVNGGTYLDPVEYSNRYYTLNLIDGCDGKFYVRGGTFESYDPSNSLSENPTENFLVEGYKTISRVVEEDGTTVTYYDVVIDE